MPRKADKKKHQTRRERQNSQQNPQENSQNSQPTQVSEPSYLDLIPPPEARGAFALTGLYTIAIGIQGRRDTIHTLEDIEEVTQLEFRFMGILEQGLESASIAENLQDPAFRIEHFEYQSLKEDLQIVKQWRERQAKVHNYLRDRIIEVEESLRPRPNFEIISTAQYLDNITFSVSEEIPEFNFRFRQAQAYFAQIIDTHCFYPRDNGTEKRPFGNETAPSFYVAPRTRIPSRKYIISPENSLVKEYLKYLVLFLTSVIKTNETPELLPYVPIRSDEPMPVVVTINGATAVAEFPTSLVD